MTNQWSAGRRIAVATAIAGTLDAGAATIRALQNARPPAGVWRFVASGPFPGATEWGTPGALLGLAVHFALMAIMAAVFVFAADRMSPLKQRPVMWGVLYGIATYVVMSFIVLPLRFGGALFPSSLAAIAPQLAFHIFLVGIPIALVARK